MPLPLKGGVRNEFQHFEKGKKIIRPYSVPKITNLGAGKHSRMIFFSNLICKDALERLRKRGTAQKVVWTIPGDVPVEYLQMLESEKKTFKGGKPIWVQIGSRPNHYFDCEVMNVCAAFMMRIIGAED